MKNTETFSKFLLNRVGRSLYAIVGLLIFALGSYFQIQANFGMSPWNSLSQGISMNYPITFGTANIIISFIIIGIDIMWTPYILDRYYMDIYFLLGIWAFICIGAWYETCEPKQQKWLNTVLFGFAGITVFASFLFFVETMGVYYPGKVTELQNIVQFWKK